MSAQTNSKKNKNPTLRFKNFSGDWFIKRIDEITTRTSNPVLVQSNDYYEQIGIRSHGKGLFYKEAVSGASLGSKRIFWITENALILNIVFAWEQAVAKTTKSEIDMVASHRFPMYLPVATELDLDFILYLFLTKRGKHLLGLASPGGAGRNKTLGQSAFDELRINLPGIAEQQKIVVFLNSVNEWILSLKQKKMALESYKRGMMKKLFTQEIRFKDGDGKNYPKWKECRLNDIGTTYNGLTGKSGNDFGEGEPFITYKQIFDESEINAANFSKVMVSEKEGQNRVQYGDILFTVSSETPNEVAFASVFLTKDSNPYLNSFSFGYRPNSIQELVPQYAKFLFRSALFRREAIKLAQ